MKKKLVFDIGGTFVKWAFVDNEYNLDKQEEFQTFESNSSDKIELLYEKICSIINEHKNNITGVGISTACVIDYESGEVLSENSTFKGYLGFKIKEFIKERTGVDVVTINDGNSGALGEMMLGSLKGVNNAAMLVIGTGIGAGLISDGKPLLGHKGFAGEVGFQIVEGEIWEEICSTRKLVENVSQGLGKPLPGQFIFNNLDKEDIRPHYDQWLRRLAIGIVNIFNILGPEVIVIGGGISQNENFSMEELKEATKPFASDYIYNMINLKKATLGNDANLIGIASLVKGEE